MQDTNSSNQKFEDLSNIGTRQPLTFIERLTLPLKLFSPSRPPSELRAFVWHFVGQHKGPFALLIFFKALEAAADLVMPVALGILATILAAQGDRMALFEERMPLLLGLGGFFLIARPMIYALKIAIVDLGIMPGFASMVRWQSHHHVLGMDITFFNNEFAGRIANRIMQTGLSVREFCIQIVDVLLYVTLYLIGALGILVWNNPLLVLPALIWLSVYIFITIWFMPEIRRRSEAHSELRSEMTGKIVDSYTNIQTVKLFAGKGQEDHAVADATDRFNYGWIRVMRTSTRMVAVMSFANGFGGNRGLGCLGMGKHQCRWHCRDSCPTGLFPYDASRLVHLATGGVFEHMGTIAEGSQSIAVSMHPIPQIYKSQRRNSV